MYCSTLPGHVDKIHEHHNNNTLAICLKERKIECKVQFGDNIGSKV